MMANMQPISKSARARSGPTEEFVELCKTLYGEAIDPDVVWSDVIKLSPDQADLHANQHSTRRRLLNGAALTGTAAGSVLGVSELARSAQAVAKPGGRISRLASKVPDIPGGPKAKLGLAATMLGADVLATNELRPRKEGASKALHDTPRELRAQVDGLRKLWKTPAGNTLKPTGGVSKKSISLGDSMELLARQNAKRGLAAPGLRSTPKVSPTVNSAPHGPTVPPAAPAAPAPTTRAEIRRREQRAARGDRYEQRQAAGADFKSMLDTNSGKVLAGGTAAYLGTKAVGGRSQSDYYGKADSRDLEFRGEFSKFDDEKKQAFGWASVVKINGEPVVDRQGDYIDLGDLEDAAYTYVHKSRVGGDMHRRNGDAPHHVSDMIESMVFTDDKVAKMGLPDDFPRGWWVGYQIHDDDTWAEVRKNGRTGFSIHGKGLRKDYELGDY